MAESRKLPVITISREYGAGGRSVARKLSERLGVEFYDIDVVRMAARESGYSEEEIQHVGEEMSDVSRFVNSFATTPASYKSTHAAINKIEHEVILKLGLQGPGIIVGRCSNIFLREAGIETFDVFLYADMKHRLARAEELAENGRMDLEKYIKQRDHFRSNYYKTFTGHEVGAYKDYNMLLDTGAIGYDKCVDMIVEALEK